MERLHLFLILICAFCGAIADTRGKREPKPIPPNLVKSMVGQKTTPAPPAVASGGIGGGFGGGVPLPPRTEYVFLPETLNNYPPEERKHLENWYLLQLTLERAKMDCEYFGEQCQFPVNWNFII